VNAKRARLLNYYFNSMRTRRIGKRGSHRDYKRRCAKYFCGRRHSHIWYTTPKVSRFMKVI